MFGAESEASRLAPKRCIRISRSNRPSPVLAGVRFILANERDRHARGACLALCPADPDAARLQYLHDHRLVLAPALQGGAAAWRHPGELAAGVRRILPGGTG